ncbi:DUF3667 domain-containing protein [Pseudozobellia thermophila]|uniref:DUF3667 domain-containing protein n=1 Tax=Pseudozobellia thermophila TaxID=192903 RepID=A0A1M6JSL3_9FLAO|nr:DUF3667 domain-containing protein [Pseudozobellia thermophila]SHJ49646.1 Protein of unknown function [Pseudozobellia thermophila]
MENEQVATQTESPKIKYRGTECLNCGHPLKLSDRFCPNCSQANNTKKLSLKDFFDEFFASFISYDSKLFKTLSALLLRPGKITRDYINGKRVSYTNPFRFLLSLAIVYFLMLGVSGGYDQIGPLEAKVRTPDFDLSKTLDTVEFENEDEKQEIMQVMDSLDLPKRIGTYIKTRDSALNADPIAYFRGLDKISGWDRIFQKHNFFETMARRDSVRYFEEARSKFKVENTRENQLTFNSGRSLFKIKERPGDFLRTLISRLPFATFFFLPLFTVFIWLAYIRKKYNYTDHLIFSFHVTSLLFILLIVSFLIDSIFKIDSNWFFLSCFSVYLFLAMRKFYGQGIFKTIVKYLFLNTIFFILAMFSVLVLIVGNMITY